MRRRPLSFLLDIPAITIAGLVELKDALNASAGTGPLPLLVGIVSAAVVSWLAIDWLLKFLQRNSTWILWYRLLFGLLLLAWWGAHGAHEADESGLCGMSHLPGLLLQLWIQTAVAASLSQLVASVETGSIEEELGFEPGDQLLSINGIRPRDLIDYRYLCVEEELCLRCAMQRVPCIASSWKRRPMTVLNWLTEALFDGLRQCNNNCPFCSLTSSPRPRDVFISRTTITDSAFFMALI